MHQGWKCLLIGVAVLLAACQSGNNRISQSPTSETTPVAPSVTTTATQTQASTHTSTASPTQTAAPSLTPTFTPTPSSTQTPISPTIDASQFQVYTDPANQYTVLLWVGWKPGAEEGIFYGLDGSFFHTAYLPEMGFMDSPTLVCMRLANTPQGPARIVSIADVGNPNGGSPDACMLSHLPEMNIDRVRVVFMNPGGDPEHRFFYLEGDAAHIIDIAKTVKLLHPVSVTGKLAHPSGPMSPENEAFWGTRRTTSTDLTLKEYAIVPDAQASPRDNAPFEQNFPADVQHEFAQVPKTITLWLEENNTLLSPFGYALRGDASSGSTGYMLYDGNDLVIGGLAGFGPVSISASGKDFVLVVDEWLGGSWLVQKGKLQKINETDPFDILGRPVFVGDDLVSVHWASDRQQLQVMKGSQVVLSLADLFGVNTGFESLHVWNGHWLLEVRGFLFEDGVNLNESLSYDEIFGWQLLNSKPFYYFRKGARVGISYDGQVQGVWYDDVFHYGCCGYAFYNNWGNPAMVGFFALRDGMWYYVEIVHNA